MSGGYLASCIFLLLIIFFLVFKNLEVWSDSLAGISEKLSPKEAEAKIELFPPASPNIERIGPNQEEAKLERASAPEGFHRKVSPESDGIKIQEPAQKEEIAPKVNSTAPANPKEAVPLSSYGVIAEKNIFSPERKDFLSPGKTEEAKRTLVRPQVTLYGIAIFGDYEAATLSYPGRPLRKGEREAATVRVGERVGGYKLAKIMPDRITLEGGGDRFEVLLDHQMKTGQRSHVRTEVKPPSTASPGAASAALPGSPSAPSAAAVPPREAVGKPPEAAQQKVTSSIPAHEAKQISPHWQRRMGIPVSPPSPPTAQVPGGATQGN